MDKTNNPKKIRALCTDVDGTLLDSSRSLSKKTIAAISGLREKMPVILASSRMPSALRHLQEELGILQHPLICYNGGYVIHYNETSDIPKVIYSTQVPVTICSAILELAQETSIHVSLYAEDVWYAPVMDEWTLREKQITKVSPHIKSGDEVLNIWQSQNAAAHKVMCMGKAEEIQVLESVLRTKFAHEIHIYHSKSTYLEIAPKIISKASALKLLLAKMYNIELDEVIAFGDNFNDIELLQSVGLGIAVGNARQEVKHVARELTANSNEDGVALAIERFLD